jgi:hypothetical protein
MPFWIMFTTTEGDSSSMAAELMTDVVYGYQINHWFIKGWQKSVDNLLSFATIRADATAALCRIKSIYIIGNKLTIIFTNTHGSLTCNVKLDGGYQVWR